jgi:hypothetical protein
MQIISPRLHGVLDYAVAAALIAVPLLLDFAAESIAATVISVTGGVGLVTYSLLTDYSAGIRQLVPWRVHLALDTVAAVALLAAPFAFGFGGLARGFHLLVAVSVLVVVALSQRETAPGPAPSQQPQAA